MPCAHASPSDLAITGVDELRKQIGGKPHEVCTGKLCTDLKKLGYTVVMGGHVSGWRTGVPGILRVMKNGVKDHNWRNAHGTNCDMYALPCYYHN